MPFTFKDVAEILKIIDASECEEMVIELEGLRLMVRRGGPQRRPLIGDASLPVNTASAGPAPTSPARGIGRAAAEVSLTAGHIGVRAPMVGTLYRRAAPQEPPFIEIGRRVAQGDPLCLIEVMKLYTTIAAPAAGVVTALLVEDGAAVEFDQLLFVIKADVCSRP